MSIMDDTDVDTDKGGDAEDSSPSDKEAGLIREIQAQRQTISSLKVESAEMKGKLDGLSQAKTEPAREFTRAELQAQVDDGRMTPDESDRILFDQMKRTVKADVTKEIRADTQSDRMNTTIQAEFKKYKEARPDIWVEGTADRELVSAEYDRQVKELGKPPNEATELDAMATMFGPTARLQNGKAKEPQTYQETGGGDGGDDGAGNSGGWPKDMPAKNRDYYEHLISQGALADRAAAVEEWNYKPKNRS